MNISKCHKIYNSPILYEEEHIGNKTNIRFTKNTIRLLDELLFEDHYMNALTEDDIRFFNRFIYEAESVFRAINNHSSDPYRHMTEPMRKLDLILGSYTGDKNESTR